MTDYKKEIDGNELFKRIAGHSYYKGDDILTRISLMQEGKLLKEKDIKPVDVVEVVRCKDCRYFHNGYDEKCCINHKGVVVTDENGFCHHAERRADNGN